VFKGKGRKGEGKKDGIIGGLEGKGKGGRGCLRVTTGVNFYRGGKKKEEEFAIYPYKGGEKKGRGRRKWFKLTHGYSGFFGGEEKGE